jgi:hypothetical protein
MKLLLYSFIIFLLSACSNEEQRFVCENDGLIIKNNVVTFGHLENMKFCEKSGTKNIYATDCSAKEKYFHVLTFDTVTYDIDLFFSDNKINSSITYFKCVKK